MRRETTNTIYIGDLEVEITWPVDFIHECDGGFIDLSLCDIDPGWGAILVECRETYDPGAKMDFACEQVIAAIRDLCRDFDRAAWDEILREDVADADIHDGR